MPKKIHQVPGLSPKGDSGVALGHHPTPSADLAQEWERAGVNTSAYEMRQKIYGGWPGVRKSSKEAASLYRKCIKDRLIFWKWCSDWTAEDWGKTLFSGEAPFQ